MFHRAEQEAAEFSALAIRAIDSAAREQAREKLLRQLARRVLVAPLAAEEGEHWRVVRRAQIAERRAGLGRIAACLDHAGPAGGGELAGAGVAHFSREFGASWMPRNSIQYTGRTWKPKLIKSLIATPEKRHSV